MMEENGLPKGWVETTLGEVVEIKNNKILTAEVNLDNYISTENLLPDKRGVTISNALPNILNVNHYKINDTLFSNIRTYFKKVWYADREGGASNDVLIFRPKNNKIFDHKFLYYHISSDNFIDFTVKTARGTKMPRGDKSAIITSKIFIPQEIQEQKAIASILTSFDDKIELLQAQNETLEATAQTIFKEWFGKYQVGDELPEGWRVGELNDLVDFVVDNRGKTPPLTIDDLESFPLVEVNSITGDDRNVSLDLVKKFVDKETYESWFRKGHPINGDVLLSTVGSIGQLAQVFDEKICIAQNIIALRSNVSGNFLYELLKNNQDLIISLDISSVQPSIKVPHLLNLDVIIPNLESIRDFDKVADNFTKKMMSNKLQIQTLQQTRDTLLPKLMSGELRVEGFRE